MTDEFENALAWFTAAPARWAAARKNDLSATAEWIWEVLQGDFHDDASGAQIAVGTVISMIPFVDQICDVRDIVANCKKIHKEPSSGWLWISLILTLIGLFPTLGSFVKGCGKVMFSSIRKTGHASGAAPEIGKATAYAVAELNKFLARPAVVKTLTSLKIHNPYKYLSIQIKTLSTQLTVAKLMKCFNDALNAVNSLLGLVKKYGGAQLATKVNNLSNVLDGVRRSADTKMFPWIRKTTELLEQLARRLDIEADMLHRAHLNTINPHAFTRFTAAGEEAAFMNAKPAWVDQTKTIPFPGETTAPHPPSNDWTSTVPGTGGRPRHKLDNAHATFQKGTIRPIIIKPGEKIYRVLDPNSMDDSICWMTEAEFKKITGKDDWRKRFAVWANWNSNGEYVTYIVPPGNGLHVWEGVVASQVMDNTDYVLKGGARQIALDPAHLKKGLMGKRQKTNWGYDDLGATTNMVGVPELKNNFK